MIPKKAINIIINLWPMLVLIITVLTMFRLAYLKTNNHKINVLSEIINLIFLIYILLLFELVTTTDFESISNNFIPFKEMLRYSITSKLFYRNVVGNVIIFVPFGYFVSYYCHKYRLILSTVISLITSGIIEITQMGIGRSFDIDDIILNVAGGVLGYICYIIFEKILSKKTRDVKNNILLNLICLVIIVILCIIILSLYGVVI